MVSGEKSKLSHPIGDQGGHLVFPIRPKTQTWYRTLWSSFLSSFEEFCSAVSEEKSTKTRWPPQPLISWEIFEFSPENAERNSTKLDRKQDLNVLYQVFFSTDRKNKMAVLASDWLRHFRHLPWNRWTEFNETWWKARSQRPLPSLCLSGWPKKQDDHPGL